MAGPRPTRRRHVIERRIHTVALRALDLTAADRRGVVEAMFNRRRRNAAAAPRVLVEYLGEPGGAAADALLGRAVSERMGTGVDGRTRAFPREPADAPAGRGAEWLPALLGAVDAVRSTDRLYACVALPGRPAIARDTALARVAERARAEALSVTGGRVAVDSAGTRWSVRYSAAPCVRPDSAAAGAGER